MSHAHAHCKHAKLEFCGHCNLVWCHDCQAEFRPSVAWWGTTGTYTHGATYGLGYKTMTNAESPVQMPGMTHHHGG